MSCFNSSRRISEEVCRLTQVKLLPSLIERDIEEFGKALTEIDLRNRHVFRKGTGRYSQRKNCGGFGSIHAPMRGIWCRAKLVGADDIWFGG